MEMLRKGTLRSCLVLLLALCLLAPLPLNANAATYETCKEAVDTVNAAIEYGEAADAIIDIIIDTVNNPDYSFIFSTDNENNSYIKSLATKVILPMLDEPENEALIESFGFEPTSSNKELLANEMWHAAWVYVKNGEKAATLELLVFVLTNVGINKESGALSEAEAQTASLDLYNMYQTYLSSGKNAVLQNVLTNVKNHAYGDWQEETQATCKQEGLNRRTCSVCGKSETQATPTSGHSPVTDPAVESTCTETGLTEGSHCGVCGETITAQETLPLAGHTPVIDSAVEPSCTETGLTEGSHCGVCGETIVAQETVPTTDHNYATTEYNDHGHWFTCSCGDKSEVETHIDEDSDSICDVCSYTKESINAPDGWGDADGNGRLSSIDASLVLQYVVELIDETELNLAVLDLNGDNLVNSFDASLILQFIVGLIDSFPVQNQQ